MPVYEYMCAACGPFTAIRPMAEYEQPQPCPDCQRKAPRVLLTAPRFSTLSVELRRAHATNERSASAPSTLSGLKAQHGAGCSCCAGPSNTKSRKTARAQNGAKNGAKSFPGARPWMISH